jgi:CDP-diacylglycerol pyrophosphatase
LSDRCFRLCLVAAAAALLVGMAAAQANPDVLWHIVHDQCVPQAPKSENPSPCAEVDITPDVDHGFVVLKDLTGNTQFLVIPSARITGIEDPALLASGASNYWAFAWTARRYVFARAHKELPRDAIGVAVNSVDGRSQNQLHIHVDCIRADVRDYLAAHAAKIARDWSGPDAVLRGHNYKVMRLDAASLSDTNLFTLLADGVPGARQDMGHWSLAAIPVSFGTDADGFVLLATHVDQASGNYGSAEELQDHDCAIAHAGP